MKSETLLTKLRSIEADLIKSGGGPSAYIALQTLISDVEREIRDECNKGAGKGSIAKAAQNILKCAQGQKREMLWKAYRSEHSLTVCDGFRAVRFNLDTAPVLETHPDRFFDYPDFGKIFAEAKRNAVPVTVPIPAELRAFIKTEKARLKAKKQKGTAFILNAAGQDIRVDAEFLLDMLEALPGAVVTASRTKPRIGALYFKAENGDGILLPCRPLKEEE
jgi:hypothetical protein